MSEPELSPEEFRQRTLFELAEHERLDREEKAFRNAIFDELRAGRFDETESALFGHLDATGVTRFDVARGARVTTPPAAIAAWIERAVEGGRTPSRQSKGLPLSAVEIGLDNAPLAFQHNKAPANPVIKMSGYTDHYFPFSTASDAEISAASGYPNPWQGGMAWLLDRYVLEGLGDLNAAVLNYRYSKKRGKFVWVDDRLEVEGEAKAAFMAELLFGLKFQRFVHDCIPQCRVPFPLVVLACGVDDLEIATMHYRPPTGRIG